MVGNINMFWKYVCRVDLKMGRGEVNSLSEIKLFLIFIIGSGFIRIIILGLFCV